MEYHTPSAVQEATALLASGERTIVSGGTDFYPSRVGRPLTEATVDISGISELRGITSVGDDFRIGALTSWTDILTADLPPAFRGLQLAAGEVGGIQVQNAGTIAGNLCNASPAADGIPPLLALGASVELASSRGVRTLDLEEFLVGYRQTAMADDEMVLAVLVPGSHQNARSEFLKLGARTFLIISIVMVAVNLDVDSVGCVQTARLAVGACSAGAVRLRSLEQDLIGRPADEHLGEVVRADHLDELDPIDDVRASAAYRITAARALTGRALRARREFDLSFHVGRMV